MDSEAISSLLEDLYFIDFSMFFITEDGFGNVVGIFEEEAEMNLFKLLTEVIVGHVEDTKIVSV
jgi:hypothetical protein